MNNHIQTAIDYLEEAIFSDNIEQHTVELLRGALLHLKEYNHIEHVEVK